jgi:hypothetical protein
MSKRFRSVIWIGLLISLFIVVLALTPYPTYISLGLYAAQNPDQIVFVGDSYSQISAVKHSDESNWDMIGSENPPIYWGAKPDNCSFTEKEDNIFSITGIWFAKWTCGP